MKKSWEYKKLDDVCTIVGRIGFRGYTKADLVNSSKDGAITLSPSNIINGELDFSKCTYINWDKYYESPEIMLENGDIVLVKTASIGKCAVVKNLPHEATLNPQFVVLKHLVGVPDFICYYLKSSIAQNTIKQMAGGVAIPTLSQKKLGMMIVPTPSQDEQQSIVDYLDSAFAKIDAMKANAEKALNEAKALFQASLKEMLEPKEGWEEKKLKEVVASITDGDHQPPPKSDDGIPFITISNIDKNSNKIVFGETFYVPQSYYCALKKDRIPQQGDVLYTVTGSFGIPVLVDFQKEFCFQRHIALIRPNMGLLSSTYLFYWILSSYATSQAEDTATGAAQRTVSLNSLRNFTINFPPLSVQQSIVETLDSLKSKVDRLQENYDKISQECDALKQAILRQVFE